MLTNKPCIQCGHCCLDMPCGAGKLIDGRCDKLIKINNLPQYKCALYPFTHMDPFTVLCLEPGEGCGFDGGHLPYKTLNLKLTNKEKPS